MYVCMYIFVCVCLFIYMYVCVHMPVYYVAYAHRRCGMALTLSARDLPAGDPLPDYVDSQREGVRLARGLSLQAERLRLRPTAYAGP